MNTSIDCIIDARAKDIGITVRRILPYAKRRMVGPFIFLDEMGPAKLLAPEDHLDVRPHPHIGLSTLTYLFEGQILHRDSLGYEQLIVPGEVNWMTAGKGISHSEREPLELRKQDRNIHGLQFWVALPKHLEEIDPSFHHYPGPDIPELTLESLSIKVVAGEAFGLKSKLHAHSPMTFVVMTARARDLFTYQSPGHEYALYIVRGALKVEGELYADTQMIVFKEGSRIEAEYSEDALFVLIGGEAFPEPRFIWWNLVSSSEQRIEEAKHAWSDGSFPQVPGDSEKIPTPEF